MNDILENLDNLFNDKSENEKWMLIMMIVLVIGYLSYSLFLPYAEDTYNQSEQHKTSLKKNIAKNKQYIASITVGGDREFYVKKYSNDILNLEKSIVQANDNINFISVKLEELSPLLFNKKSWSKFLNSLTKEAKNQGVDIDYIENEYVDNNGSFGHILEISVGCKGEYKNIVKFINKIEKNILVTDIYGNSIRLEDNATTTYSDINISVWGINH
jgi:Tfp pilus assembly protein PilO